MFIRGQPPTVDPTRGMDICHYHLVSAFITTTQHSVDQRRVFSKVTVT